MMRTRFSSKRRLANPTPSEAVLLELARRVTYGGSPYHKRDPGDFGLIPPAQPRPDKTLCDDAGIIRVADAIHWLREGVRRGMISAIEMRDFPSHVWAVTQNGIVLEAALTNVDQGQYHGYPLFEPDPFREVILERWSRL
jgi:hypothetical protein